jgi:hypothetical protein
VARLTDCCGYDIDPLDYRIKHEGTWPSAILPREDLGSLPGTVHQGSIWRS